MDNITRNLIVDSVIAKKPVIFIGEAISQLKTGLLRESRGGRSTRNDDGDEKKEKNGETPIQFYC